MRNSHDLTVFPITVARIQLLLLAAVAFMLPGALYAQDASSESAAAEEIEEIMVTGSRATIQSTVTFNGRMATNGTGDRSVNFSQFPSELMNKLAIFKTLDTSLIEGGVAGLVELETLRPLDN